MAACECMKEQGEKTIQCFHFSAALKYFPKYPGKVLHRFLVHCSRGWSFNSKVYVPLVTLKNFFKASQNTKDNNQKTLEKVVLLSY